MTTTQALHLAVMTATALAAPAQAAPASYKPDPLHTYSSLKADPMGISVWRGKMSARAAPVQRPVVRPRKRARLRC